MAKKTPPPKKQQPQKDGLGKVIAEIPRMIGG